MGVSKNKTKFAQIFAKSREINLLSAARFFLFGSRDIWFVVGLPVFLQAAQKIRQCGTERSDRPTMGIYLGHYPGRYRLGLDARL